MLQPLDALFGAYPDIFGQAVEHAANIAMAPLKQPIVPTESVSRHGKNQGEKSGRRT
jgi:hypothetical protein